MTVDLVPRWVVGEVDLTSYPFSVDAEDGVEVGEPELVVEEVVSNLADGDEVREIRHGNRTYVIPVFIEGPTLGELAASEALLRTELKKASREGLELLHDPGDGLVPSSVYQVRSATMTPERRDLHESHLIRKWTLTLTCAPFARSAEPMTVAALPSGSTTTLIDACTSTSGWSATRSGSPTGVVVTGGTAVEAFEFDDAVTTPEVWTLTRTGSVSFASTPYLVAEVKTQSSSDNLGMNVLASVVDSGGTVNLPLIDSRKMVDDPKYYRMVFDASAVVGDASSITFHYTSLFPYPWQLISVRNVERTDVAPQVTSRQFARILQVGGTERTPASIHVSSANGTDNLGTTIIHTSPEDGSGYSPPLRRWRVSGNTETPNTELFAFSGEREPIHPNAFVAEVPTSSLPDGGYLLAAFLRCTSTEDVRIYWAFDTIPPGGSATGHVEDSIVWSFEADIWMLVPIAVVSLPTVRTKSGTISLAIQRDVLSGAQVEMDEAWLFRMGDDCALSAANVDYPHLWLDSPGLENAVPTMWVGDDAATRTHPGPGLLGMGSHVLSPEGTALFTATAATNNPSAEAEFYRRWHSNAAE